MTKKPATVDDVLEVLQDFVSLSNERFERSEAHSAKLEQRFDRLDIEVFRQGREIDTIKKDIKTINEKVDQIYGTLDSHLQRLELIMQENAARDRQHDRLERWIFQLADAASVKLKYE